MDSAVPKGAGDPRAENWSLQETAFQSSGCWLQAMGPTFGVGLPLPGPRPRSWAWLLVDLFPSLLQKPGLVQRVKKADHLLTVGWRAYKAQEKIHLKKSISSPRRIEKSLI